MFRTVTVYESNCGCIAYRKCTAQGMRYARAVMGMDVSAQPKNRCEDSVTHVTYVYEHAS